MSEQHHTTPDAGPPGASAPTDDPEATAAERDFVTWMMGRPRDLAPGALERYVAAYHQRLDASVPLEPPSAVRVTPVASAPEPAPEPTPTPTAVTPLASTRRPAEIA